MCKFFEFFVSMDHAIIHYSQIFVLSVFILVIVFNKYKRSVKQIHLYIAIQYLIGLFLFVYILINICLIFSDIEETMFSMTHSRFNTFIEMFESSRVYRYRYIVSQLYTLIFVYIFFLILNIKTYRIRYIHHNRRK